MTKIKRDQNRCGHCGHLIDFADFETRIEELEEEKERLKEAIRLLLELSKFKEALRRER